MARLSTGQAYGDATRASAARLLGGIPTDASAGALAQGSIATPSLQPRATPVDTFQRVGAPTLGGAPKFFAPPDLPNPGQDLANLSKALGGFSTTLQSFGETWLANRQEQEKKLEASTKAFVGQGSQYGPARTLANFATNLEKAAALGDPNASRRLQILREKQNNSVGRYWLERSIEDNAIQNAALSLPDRLAATSVIKVDGRDVDFGSLSSDDPRYLKHRDLELFGGVQMSATGYAKNQGIIVQAQLQADQAQRKRANAVFEARQTGQLSANQKVIANKYVYLWDKGDANAAIREVGQASQKQIDQLRLLGLPQEAQSKLTNGYLETLASNIFSAIQAKGAGVYDMELMLRPALRSIMTGPIDQRVKADGTPNEALRLYNQLGGEPYLDQVIAKIRGNQIQEVSQQSQVAEIKAQQDLDQRLQSALPEGRRSDPGAIKQFEQSERERIAQNPNGIERAAMTSKLNAVVTQLTETYVKPVQEQRALWYAQQLGNTLNDEAARNQLRVQVEADLKAGLISGTTAVDIQKSLSAQGSKEVRSYDKDINKRIDDQTKLWTEYIKSPGSYGDSTITGFETQALYKFRDDARRKSQDTVYQAIKDGKDPVEALNKLWKNSNWGLQRREDANGAQAPVAGGAQDSIYEDNTKLIAANTGNWSRSSISAGSANYLKDQTKKRALYKAAPFTDDVDALFRGNPSQNFKMLLKTLTTGPNALKPSEVILNQFRLHGISVPEDQIQRIKALDGQKISAVPPAGRVPAQQNGALNGIQIATRALNNVLVPPAAAFERPNMPPPVVGPPAILNQRTTRQSVTPQARVDGYLKRLSYLETRIRNVPNAEGSAGRGYFQAFPPFASEAIAASNGIDPRDSDYGKAAKATAAWISAKNKPAWKAIREGRYDDADRLLRYTWPSLPPGSQAQKPDVQKAARKYLR